MSQMVTHPSINWAQKLLNFSDQTVDGCMLPIGPIFINRRMNIVEVDFLWNRTVDSSKTSFHVLL